MTNSSGDVRASDGPRQLNVALAGLGFMGTTHLKAWKQVPGVRVMAVTDADPKRRAGDLTSAGGNFGGPGEVMDFSNVKQYPTLKELLADPEIDAVDICLPTDEHGKAGLAVLRAGKHALIEKPMATDEGRDCRASRRRPPQRSSPDGGANPALQSSLRYARGRDKGCWASSLGGISEALCRANMEQVADGPCSKWRGSIRSFDSRRRLLHFALGHARIGSRYRLRGFAARDRLDSCGTKLCG